MKVKNEGNSEVLILLDADASDGWDATVVSQNGAQVVTVPAFSEVSFTVTIETPEEAKNGDEMTVVVSAKPLSEDESYPDEFTARKTVNLQIAVNNLIDRIGGEIFDPGPVTILIGLAFMILLVASISGRRNRVEYIDVWVDEDEFEEETQMELPDTVSAEDDDFYDDDEIELIDFD